MAILIQLNVVKGPDIPTILASGSAIVTTFNTAYITNQVDVTGIGSSFTYIDQGRAYNEVYVVTQTSAATKALANAPLA